jgi:hypothetical protein
MGLLGRNRNRNISPISNDMTKKEFFNLVKGDKCVISDNKTSGHNFKLGEQVTFISMDAQGSAKFKGQNNWNWVDRKDVELVTTRPA